MCLFCHSQFQAVAIPGKNFVFSKIIKILTCKFKYIFICDIKGRKCRQGLILQENYKCNLSLYFEIR